MAATFPQSLVSVNATNHINSFIKSNGLGDFGGIFKHFIPRFIILRGPKVLSEYLSI
jgi:hypothetical protein